MSDVLNAIGSIDTAVRSLDAGRRSIENTLNGWILVSVLGLVLAMRLFAQPNPKPTVTKI
jgi:hypothetical protein